MYRLENLTPYFQKSVTFTKPNEDIRRDNVSTVYDTSAFVENGGPVQVGYTNWVSSWATWLEKGLKAVGMERTNGFASGNLTGYHYSQATIRGSDQTRSSSAEYIYSAQDSATKDNLKIFTQTLAKKVLFEGKKATGKTFSLMALNATCSMD
jgi:choline dehydrogenase-like flavoprotein